MKEKIRQIISIVIFFAILWIPVCTFRQPGHVSIVENKITATMPAIAKENLLQQEWVAAVEDCITDNMGMKEEATLLYISGMYKIFDDIAIANYVEGTDGHIFYLTDAILSDLQGNQSLTNYEEFEEALLTLQSSFSQRDCEFFFMPIPNKESLYWENFPETISGSPENTMLHQLILKLEETTSGLNIVPVEEKMLEHKQDGELLYYRNIDASHWNSYGMYIGYQALMEEMQRVVPSLSYFKEGEVTITRQEQQQAFLYLQSYDLIHKTFLDFADYVYQVMPVNGWHWVQDNTQPAGFILAGDTQDLYFHYSNPLAKNEGCLVIYGDSYIYTFMLPMLAETFSEVYFINANSCSTTELTDLLQYVDPDYFLFEAVARQLNAARIYDLLAVIQDSVDAVSG